MQSYFGGAPKIDLDKTFNTSFAGMVKHEQIYYDPYNGVDLRKDIGQEMINKAPSLSTTTGGAGTAGYALIPVYVDPNIIDRTRKRTPLVELIPRMAVKGTTVDSM